MLNVDLMRVKPLRGPLKRDDAKELQNALKEAGIGNPVYWNFNSPALYYITEDNFVEMESRIGHYEIITFEDLREEKCEELQFENELMALLGG